MQTFTIPNTPGSWLAFWRDNAEALEAEGLTEGLCLSLARHGNLLIGGGAAPLVRVVLEPRQ